MAKEIVNEIKSLEDAKAQPHIEIAKLKVHTHLLIETNVGTLFSLAVRNPKSLHVELTGTLPYLKDRPPQDGQYHEAWLTREGGIVVKGWIIKDMRMTVKLADGLFISEPVVAALIEGEGWKYDAI